MHRVWETVADALLWLQLCWVFFGFALMAYLAFKVFPKSENPPGSHPSQPMASNPFRFSGDEVSNLGAPLVSASNRSTSDGIGQRSYPASTVGKIIQFGTKISGQNRSIR